MSEGNDYLEGIEPTRELEISYDDNGCPSWRSFCSPKSVKVRGECRVPTQLPGLVIFVHGVNSTGEWYEAAERSLCKGLNHRLGLTDSSFELKANVYSCDENAKERKNKKRRQLLDCNRSPIIRFYWGYRSPQGEEGKYRIPLVNIDNEDYHQLLKQEVSKRDILKKGPFFWGGGPFQNGTDQLTSLWSKVGFKSHILGGIIDVEDKADFDRRLTDAPSREYYAHAATRLATLLDSIREKYPADTVSIISHSQGTMIAMAATLLAKAGPDALFVLNSPFSLEFKTVFDRINYPGKEQVSTQGRLIALSSIVEKVASRATHLSSQGTGSLCVGQSCDRESWTPRVMLRPTAPQVTGSTGQPVTLSERDNHGRTWIYFSPHDRVMGSNPLLSIGWQGLKNKYDGQPHPLLQKYPTQLYQRVLVRWLPCGDVPRVDTPLTPTDGKPFWDDGGDWTTYNEIGYWTVFINGEQVPSPIRAGELPGLDKSRVGIEEKPGEVLGPGWGQFTEDSNTQEVVPNDDTFDNYYLLYPKIKVVARYQRSGSDYPKAVAVMRDETDAEHRARIAKYISQPTDHSELPSSEEFMPRVVAYDLPIGYCESSWDKCFMQYLRDYADWTQGYDPYFEQGELNYASIPDVLKIE
nr:DUF3274 domain-containing protein [Pantoea sp. 201603H]